MRLPRQFGLNALIAATVLVPACLVATLLLAPTSCTKAPPNLTPPATRAFYGTQILHDLDRLREVAVAAHGTAPPLIDATETLKIVTWHQQAIALVHAAEAGWQAAVSSGLDALLKDLSPHAQQTLAPWIPAIKLLLQEIPCVAFDKAAGVQRVAGRRDIGAAEDAEGEEQGGHSLSLGTT